MDENCLNWLNINGNGLTVMKMCKFLMLLIWHEKCQGGVTWGFCSQNSMHC